MARLEGVGGCVWFVKGGCTDSRDGGKQRSPSFQVRPFTLSAPRNELVAPGREGKSLLFLAQRLSILTRFHRDSLGSFVGR